MGKQKLFLSSIIVFLMFSSIYMYTTPKAQATEISATQKGLSILDDVLGVNLEKYRITSTERQDSFLGVIPEEKVQYTFNSSTSNLKFLCTFANGQLVVLHVLEKEGEPVMTKSIDNLLETTKDFLTTYQQYSGNTLYGELRSMLEKVDTLKNATITSGTTKLEVTNSETIKGFTWLYTYNGISASSKCVIVSYENGFLKYFIDTWNLYKVGSTDINLSEEEAVEIAYENAEKYSWEVNIDNTTKAEINNFNLTDVAVKQLIFCNSHNADNPRGTDTMMLFPMWRIGINLDKFYPGNVYGIYVDIWADTKQVRGIEEVFTTLDPEFFSTLGAPYEIATIEESSIEESQPSSLLSTATFLLFPIVFLFGVVGVLLFLRTKGLYCLSSKRSYEIFALLICFLMFFSIVASSVSPTGASMYKGRATIWGSLAPYKTSGELEHQDLICDIINGRFDANGYTSLDLQGPSSNKNYFLNRIAFDEDLSYRHATVWFDHGIGEGLNFPDHPNEWHFMLCDSNNDKIYDYEISERTQGRTKFALINTCLSAKIDLNWLAHWPADPDGDGLLGNGYYGNDPRNAKPIGMPYAFTHVAYLDTTGYETPDTSSSFCYIGFSAGSASLVQAIDPAIPSIKYYDWVWEFLNSSLNFDMTIKDALDDASQSCYPNIAGFGGTKLHTGFTSVWAGSPIYYGDHDKMEVYGNTLIKLHQPTLTLSASGGPTPMFTIQRQSGGPIESYATGDHYMIPDFYTIDVQNLDGYIFQGFTYNGVPMGRPANIQVALDGQLVANYVPAATPTPTPTFVPTPTPNPTLTSYISSVNGYSGATNPNNLVGSAPDGQYAGIVGMAPPYWPPSGVSGWIAGALNQPVTGHIYLYGYGVNSGPLRVYTSTDGSNWVLRNSVGVGPTPQWIDCGSVASQFSYIKLSTDPVGMYGVSIDCIGVQ